MDVGRRGLILAAAGPFSGTPNTTLASLGELRWRIWSGLVWFAKVGSMMVRNISQAKAELSALIEEVQKGEEVILAKAGKPVAKLVAYRGPARPRTPGAMSGEIWIAEDFDTLPDDIADSFGMRDPEK